MYVHIHECSLKCVLLALSADYMFMSAYIYIYIYIYITYIYTYIRIEAFGLVSTETTHIRTYSYIHAYANTYNIHTFTHKHTGPAASKLHKRDDIYIHYIYTHIHTNINTQHTPYLSAICFYRHIYINTH
jgi:hypothetical protein